MPISLHMYENRMPNMGDIRSRSLIIARLVYIASLSGFKLSPPLKINVAKVAFYTGGNGVASLLECTMPVQTPTYDFLV